MTGTQRSIANLDGFDFEAFSRGARKIVADDWDAEARRHDIAADNLSDPVKVRTQRLLAQDIRESADRLRRGLQP